MNNCILTVAVKVGLSATSRGDAKIKTAASVTMQPFFISGDDFAYPARLARQAQVSVLRAEGICPAVGRFVEANPFQLKVIAIGVPIERGQDAESGGGQVLGCRHNIQQHRLVAGEGGQKVHDRLVLLPRQESVIPQIHHVGLGDGFDVTEVHDHAVGWRAVVVDDMAAQGNFHHIAVAVKVAALALMVGNAMAGIEL